MRQFALVIGGLCSLSAATLIGADLVRNFDGVNYTLADYTYLGVPGRLYVPPGYSAGTPTPLVLFLHGYGERSGAAGADAQVNGNMSNLLVNAKAKNYFVFAPQSSGWWSELDKTVRAIGAMGQQYNIDPNRLYVTGLSAGGFGTMTAMRNYSTMFAGYVPLSAAGGEFTSPADAAPAVGRPAWYFGGTGSGDITFTMQMQQSVTNTLTAQGVPAAQQPVYPATNYTYTSPDPGGLVRYTQYAGANHDNSVWNYGAYATPAMYTWLLSQHNATTKLQPGRSICMGLLGDAAAAPTGVIDSKGQYWNVSTGYQANTVPGGVIQTQATDNTGTRTTTTIELTKGFYGQGTTTLPANAACDASVASGYGWLYTWNIHTAEVVVHGLMPGSLYDMDLFASIATTAGSTDYIGLYSAGDKSITINAANNASISTLSGLAADSSGNLVLDVNLSGNSTYAVLNTISVTAAVPEPTALAFVLGAAGVAALRRRQS